MLLIFKNSYDTTTSFMGLCLYFLALNPDVQEEAIKEVEKVSKFLFQEDWAELKLQEVKNTAKETFRCTRSEQTSTTVWLKRALRLARSA